MIEVERIKPSGLFTNYIFKTIPLAFDESMSYYECLCGLLNYMKNTMIPALNNNADAVIEVQNLMTELQAYVDNYFDNEFPEMLDTKLDELVENGTIANILENYANIERVFNTAEEMKSDTTLVAGQKIKTLGYYNVNDGGGAEYIIKDEEPSNYYENIGNVLYAELIEDVKDTVNVLQCGAYSDGVTDNSTIFNSIISYANENLKNIYLPSGNYLIEDDLIDINGCISLYGNTSGEGQKENKATILDNRTSTNYLLNFVQVLVEGSAIKGGTVSNINFKDLKVNTNNCIKTNNSINYFGNISHCNFWDYKVAIYVNQSHGTSINTCSFIRCGDKIADSLDYAIIINDTSDVSIDNCCIDHSRYQLYCTLSSIVHVSNTHFEITKLNLVKGHEPIYAYVGNYGHVSFTNCSFINLSYKEWIDTAGYTTSNCIFMIYGTYADFTNCYLQCGSGSASYTSTYSKQAKFINLYYGSIDNCKIKSPSYLVPAFNMISSTMNNCHIQCDLEPEDYSMNRSYYIVKSMNINFNNNYLQFIIPTTDPQTYPTNYPAFSNMYSQDTYIETNKQNIFFTTRVPYEKLKAVNTLRIQSNGQLFGAYHLKIYSIGEAKLFYDGFIRINTNKSFAEILNIQRSFASSNAIKLYSDDNSNDVYIQILEPTYRTNTVVIELENLKGHTNVIMYFDNNIQEALTYTNSLDLTQS